MSLFDGVFERMPTPSQEEAPEKEIVGLTMEEVEQIGDFLEARLENPELGLLSAAAAAYDAGDWDGLAKTMQKKGGGAFSGEQLKSGLMGSELLKNASERYHALQQEGKMDEAA